MGISQTAYIGIKAVTPTIQKYRLFPGKGHAGAQIGIFGDDLDFGSTTDTVWFGAFPAGPPNIINWKPNRIDLWLPAGLAAGNVYEVKVAHGRLLTYLGNFAG